MKGFIRFYGLQAVVWVLGIVPGKGDYILSANLDWKGLDTALYKVHLNIYRDCSGASITNRTFRLYYRCADNNSVAGPDSLTGVRVVHGIDITPVCAAYCLPCDSTASGGDTTCPFGYGIQYYRYEFVADVSALRDSGCCWVRFFWHDCCRSAHLTNLDSPSQQSYYTYAELNFCAAPFDEGITWNTPEFGFYCKGQDVYHESSWGDPEDDSTIIEWESPRQWDASTGTSKGVRYAVGFSPSSPLAYLGFPVPNFPPPLGMHLHPGLGDFRFRPTRAGFYTVGVKVRQYRNGQLIAHTLRERTMIIVECPSNSPPRLSGINGDGSNFSAIACEGRELCFTVSSFDYDVADTLYMEWDSGIAGASFTVTPPSMPQAQTIHGPTGRFCWTPPRGAARPQPYPFKVTVWDGQCPIKVPMQRTFNITVKPAGWTDSLPSLCLQGDTLHLAPYGHPPGGWWAGPGVDSATGVFDPAAAGPGTHRLTYHFTQPGWCLRPDTAEVRVHPMQRAHFTPPWGDSVVCAGMPTVLHAAPPGGQWAGPHLTDSLFDAPDTGWHALTYAFIDSHGCRSVDTLPLYVRPRPLLRLHVPDDACAVDTPIRFRATTQYADSVRWTASGDGQFVFTADTAAAYRLGPQERHSDRLMVRLIGYAPPHCPPDTVSAATRLHPLPSAAFTVEPDSGCAPLVATFTDHSSIEQGTIARRRWHFSDGHRAEGVRVTHRLDSAGTYGVSLRVESDQGCTDSITDPAAVVVFPTPRARFRPQPPITDLWNPRIQFINETEGADSGMGRTWWDFGDGHSDSSWHAVHTYADTGRYAVLLVALNGHGCPDSFTHTVVIEPPLVLFAPNAFTPDWEGPRVNDVFRITASGFVQFHVAIYNRWGRRVYASDDYGTHGWDGTIDGRPAPEGVYFWKAAIIDPTGTLHQKKGMVTLVR